MSLHILIWKELPLDIKTILELHYSFTRFGSIAVSWRPTMCKPTKANLQDAWRLAIKKDFVKVSLFVLKI